ILRHNGMNPRYKTKRMLVSVLRLTRPWNLFIIALAQYFTAVLLVDRSTIFDWKLFLMSASTVLIAAGGYIINDYYDIKIDLINKPERVVIGKNVTRRYAILLHSAFSILGVFLGLIVHWKIAMVNFASVFLLWWYSNDLKRQPFIGNVVVALLTGVSIMIIDAIYKTGNILIVIYACFAFFMTLIREIIKDIEDLKGDNTFGCRTLPIVWGTRKTKFVIYLILAAFCATVLTLNLIYVNLPLHYFLVFLFIPLLLMLYRLIRADTKKDFSWLSGFCKIIILLGIFSMAFIIS
ncbi:MAG: geranylgeranylglycerol-phosphate geranylgeranyltransferase, partial [Bacteroidota bacterium]